jgi:hypothetical protein
MILPCVLMIIDNVTKRKLSEKLGEISRPRVFIVVEIFLIRRDNLFYFFLDLLLSCFKKI